MKENKESAAVIGKVKFPDFEAYLTWFKENAEAVFSFNTPDNIWKNHIYDLQGKLGFNVSSAFDRSSPQPRNFTAEEHLKDLKEIVNFYNCYNLPLKFIERFVFSKNICV